jgi:hypothetical protein
MNKHYLHTFDHSLIQKKTDTLEKAWQGKPKGRQTESSRNNGTRIPACNMDHDFKMV